MGLHLYCIVPPGHPPPDGLLGLEGMPVEGIETPPVAVWCSESTTPLSPSLERIRIHDKVIRAATSEHVTPLPVRFGQWLSGRDLLCDRIAEEGQAYEQALRTVAGAVEFGVRLSDPAARRTSRAPAATRGPGAGRAYLRDLARHRAGSPRAEEAARRLRDVVAPSIRASSEHGGPDGELLLAHLVDRGEVRKYREAVTAFRRRHPEVTMSLSGPWPPYSFGP